MRIFGLILILHLWSFKILSQSLEWSNTQKFRGQSVFTTILGEDESGIYIMRHRNKFISNFIVLERYRQNLGFETSKSFLLRHTRVLFTDFNESGVFFIKSMNDNKGHVARIVASVLNTSFDATVAENEICTFKKLSAVEGLDPVIKASPDHKHYFLLIPSSPYHYRYFIVNQNCTLHSSGEFSLKEDYGRVKVKDLIFKNSLQFSVLFSIQNKKESKDSYAIFEANQLKLVLDAHHILCEPMLYSDFKTNRTGLTGFYTSSLDQGYEGNFILNYNPEQPDSIKVLKIPFSHAILKDLQGESQATTGFLNSTYVPLKLIPRSDGGFIKLCENTWVRKEQEILMTNGMPSSQGKKIFIFENILLQNFDSTGQIVWENTVIKNQNSINDGGSLGSVFIGVTPGSLNLIYNDPIAVGGDIVITQFSPNGQKQSKILARGDEMNAFIIASEGKLISPYKMVIPIIKDRKFAMLKLSFNP